VLGAIDNTLQVISTPRLSPATVSSLLDLIKFIGAEADALAPKICRSPEHFVRAFHFP
jgi:hypothetical protein